jgi:plasmid maintenance system antidote protein VapI
MSNQYNPDYCTHPGEHVAEALRHLNLNKKYELSKYQREVLLDIILGIQRISTIISDELAYIFNTSPDIWLNLQKQYDEWACKHEHI